MGWRELRRLKLLPLKQLMARLAVADQVFKPVSFFVTLKSKVAKWFDVMNVESLAILFGSLSARLADLISLARKLSLSAPARPIVSAIAALKMWVRITQNVLGSPFTVTSIATEVMLSRPGVIPVTPSKRLAAPVAWRSSLTTRDNSVSAFQFSSAGIRAGQGVVNSSRLKGFHANWTLFFNKPALRTKGTSSSTPIFTRTIFTNTRGFPSRHTPNSNALMRIQQGV